MLNDAAQRRPRCPRSRSSVGLPCPVRPDPFAPWRSREPHSPSRDPPGLALHGWRATPSGSGITQRTQYDLSLPFQQPFYFSAACQQSNKTGYLLQLVTVPGSHYPLVLAGQQSPRL